MALEVWSLEQVEAIAPTPATFTASRPLATPSRWANSGADDHGLWGSCRGSGAEPYDIVVDHVGVHFACTCPSRRRPCKHALALLVLWANGQIAGAARPTNVARWLEKHPISGLEPAPDVDANDAGPSSSGAPASATPDLSPVDDGEATGGSASEPDAATGAGSEGTDPRGETERSRDDRVERMHSGLVELDRWLDDRIRTGLADPALARYGTWDQLAARLVDARAGSLANRIRRLAGLVGASPEWHGEVLAELGLLHLLAQAGRRLGSLPGPLADAVATTVGWQVRQAEVLAGVPDTDDWVVAGRSDTREDRIEVRRHWLRGARSGRWALVLSFAAYRQSLDSSLRIGTAVTADLHRYPGPALRALVGDRHGPVVEPARPPASDLIGACDHVGAMLAAEPWLDRVPFTARAALAEDGSRLVLSDDGGSVPLLRGDQSYATLLAVAAGDLVDVTCEWTPHGVVPLAVHLPERTIDIGPRADESFVGAA